MRDETRGSLTRLPADLYKIGKLEMTTNDVRGTTTVWATSAEEQH
jgi:hypothetical protein